MRFVVAGPWGHQLMQSTRAGISIVHVFTVLSSNTPASLTYRTRGQDGWLAPSTMAPVMQPRISRSRTDSSVHSSPRVCVLYVDHDN